MSVLAVTRMCDRVSSSKPKRGSAYADRFIWLVYLYVREESGALNLNPILLATQPEAISRGPGHLRLAVWRVNVPEIHRSQECQFLMRVIGEAPFPG